MKFPPPYRPWPSCWKIFVATTCARGNRQGWVASWQVPRKNWRNAKVARYFNNFREKFASDPDDFCTLRGGVRWLDPPRAQHLVLRRRGDGSVQIRSRWKVANLAGREVVGFRGHQTVSKTSDCVNLFGYCPVLNLCLSRLVVMVNVVLVMIAQPQVVFWGVRNAAHTVGRWSSCRIDPNAIQPSTNNR
jgi:hypothetical protein